MTNVIAILDAMEAVTPKPHAFRVSGELWGRIAVEIRLKAEDPRPQPLRSVIPLTTYLRATDDTFMQLITDEQLTGDEWRPMYANDHLGGVDA